MQKPEQFRVLPSALSEFPYGVPESLQVPAKYQHSVDPVHERGNRCQKRTGVATGIVRLSVVDEITRVHGFADISFEPIPIVSLEQIGQGVCRLEGCGSRRVPLGCQALIVVEETSHLVDVLGKLDDHGLCNADALGKTVGTKERMERVAGLVVARVIPK